jgi:hypothetical protein
VRIESRGTESPEITPSQYRRLPPHLYNQVDSPLCVHRERSDGSLWAYGSIWNVLFGYEHLLDRLEKAKDKDIGEECSKEWEAAIGHAWHVLDKYYQRLDDCPAYYAAVALHTPKVAMAIFRFEVVIAARLGLFCKVEGQETVGIGV